MKRRVFLSFAVLVCVIFAAAGAGMQAEASDYKLVLRLSHVFHPDEQLTKSMDWVAERILKRTNGAIEIQTFPQGQIAVYKDGMEQVVRGADFISVEDPSYVGDYVPDFIALVGPMLYNSYDEYVEMIKTDLVQDMIKRAEEKGIKILALEYVFGFRNVIPAAVFFGMIPISEIAFILLQAGLDSGAVPWDVYSFALNTVILSMLLGPPATALTAPVYALFKRRRKVDAVQTVNISPDGLSGHVIVAGGGIFARHIGLVLHSMRLPYVVIEPNHALFLEAKKKGLRLLLGDPGQDAVLEAACVEKAKLLVLTLHGALEIQDVVSAVRKRNRTLRILARDVSGEGGEFPDEDREISRIIQPEFEAGLEMARQALIHLDVPGATIHRELETLRRNVYGPLRENNADYGLLSQLLHAASTLELEWEAIHKDGPLEGKTIAGANIRAEFGVSVVAVLRDGALLPNPGGDFILREGDLVGIIGTMEQNQKFFCFLDEQNERCRCASAEPPKTEKGENEE